jgi:hypothetical protein
MSGINYESLFDIDNIGDLVSDGLGAIKKTISNLFDGDGFGGGDTFKAVVISNPVMIDFEEASALGYVQDNSDAYVQHQKFKVRIVNKSGNPHAVLADPCDIASSGDSEENCLQNALVAAHTTIVINEVTGVMIGSFVEIRLDKNANRTFNTQTGHFIKKLSDNTSGHSALSIEACEDIQHMMAQGESYTPPPTVKLPSEIRELAEIYDKNGQIPNKSQHRKFLYGDHPPTLNKPFELWFKAFIAKIFMEKGTDISVHIVSGFRTVAQQEELRAEYEARKAANKGKPHLWGLPAACGTCSRHIGGSAIDINLNWMGIDIKSTDSNDTWRSTGVVEIAESLGLKWGGNFKQRDTVHFELEPFADAQAFFAQNAGRTVRYDTINEGHTTAEEIRHDELLAGGETSDTSDNSDIRGDLDTRLGEYSTSE